MEKSTIKLIRKGPIMLFVLLTLLLGIASVDSYNKINKKVKIHVWVAKRLPENTYKRVIIGENTFVTGSEGEVYWKPKSFKEAFILETIVNKDYNISLFDIIYLFMLNGLYFWIVFDIKSGNLFNSKVLKVFSPSGFFILYISLMLKNLVQFRISDYFLDHITQGFFRVSFSMDSWSMVYILLISLFPFVQPFILKAQQVEHEQNLTI